MPQVPYNPVPDVAPQDVPAPGFHPNVPPEAFGTNIAQAVQHLGSTVSQVGDELWNRAVSIQEMNNETAATKATADLELSARKRALDFTTNQQGLNAGQALPGEMQAQNDLREQYRAGLNPAAARMYDRYSLRIMNGELGNIAAHAARESHVAAVAERKNALEVIYDGVMQNPTPENLSDGFARAGETMRGMAAQEGWSPEVAARKEMEIKSGLKERFIEGLSHTDPQKANAYFEANRSTMTYEDIKKLENIIPARNRQVGTRIASDAIHEGWQPYMSPAQRRVFDGVATPLTSIVQRAQAILANEHKEILPAGPRAGQRSPQDQIDIWRESKGGTLFAAAPPGSSRHEMNPGRAVDLNPGNNTTYADIQRAMYQASNELGIPLSDEHARLGARDRPHYSLPRDYDLGSAPVPKKASLQDQVDTGKRFAARAFPNDPAFPDELESRIRGNFHASDQINRQTIQDNMDILQDGLYDRGDGQPPRNLEELLSDPRRQQAYDTLRSMDPGKANSWPARIVSYNRAIAVHSDPQLLTHFDGMRIADPDEFQKQDFIGDDSLQMGQRDRRTYAGFQRADLKSGAADKVVRRALSLPDVAAMIALPDNQLNRRDPAEKDNYYDFVGSLKGAIDYETERNKGKPPSDDELREIVKKELYGRSVTKEPLFTVPGRIPGISGPWFGGTSQNPIWNVGKTLSDSEREEVRQKLIKQNPNSPVTERDIDIQASKDLYDKLKTESKVPKLGGP